ncbi:MAG: hypothetical protein RLY86_3834 [Pseudomonadota bacterium]|jgi:urea carboxylase-associated protein 2
MTSIDEYRRRYEALKAKGRAPKTLPPPTDPATVPLDPATVLRRETIPGGWYWTTVLRRGQGLRLTNTSGTPGISLLAWNLADPSERYNSADTVKVQWTAALRKGRVLFSDMGRVMLSIVEDSCGRHDTIIGGSTPGSVLARHGSPVRNTRENFILAAGKHGLGRRDVPPCITFFAPVATTAEGRFVWEDGVVRSGDLVDLRAEIDLIVALSNCPHPLAPGDTFAPGEVEVVVFTAPPAGADDLCRTATEEAVRGFQNTDAANAA